MSSSSVFPSNIKNDTVNLNDDNLYPEIELLWNYPHLIMKGKGISAFASKNFTCNLSEWIKTHQIFPVEFLSEYFFYTHIRINFPFSIQLGCIISISK